MIIDLEDVFSWGVGTFGYNLKGYQEKKDAFQATAASPVVDKLDLLVNLKQDIFIHGIGLMMIGMSM